jgi:hypothetical protein
MTARQRQLHPRIGSRLVDPLLLDFRARGRPARAAGTATRWVLGGGVEAMLFPGWFVKTEYRFADYESKTTPIPVATFPYTITQDGKVKRVAIECDEFWVQFRDLVNKR